MPPATNICPDAMRTAARPRWPRSCRRSFLDVVRDWAL